MMQSLTYTIKVHPPDADHPAYFVEVPALSGCFTQGGTYAEAVANAREAIEGFLEALVKAGEPIPTESSPTKEITATIRVETAVAA